MNAVSAIQLTLVLPLIAIVLALLFDKRPNVREMFTLSIGAALLWVVIVLTRHLSQGDGGEWTLPLKMIGGLPLAFKPEPLGMLFALVAAGLWMRLHNNIYLWASVMNCLLHDALICGHLEGLGEPSARHLEASGDTWEHHGTPLGHNVAPPGPKPENL